MDHNCFLVALGGNQPSVAGAPLETLQAALAGMAGAGLTLRAVSRFYETPCFPVGAGPDYVNGAVCVSAKGSADDVLKLLHRIEASFGRDRVSRWASRPLDLDLLASGDAILPDRATYDTWRSLPAEEQTQRAPEELILPHPRLQDRGFVLRPLCDIAPDWRHPVSGKTVREMLDALPDADLDGIRPL